MTTQVCRWRVRGFGELFRIKHGYAFKGQYFTDRGKYIVLTPGNFYEEGGFRTRGEKEKYYVGEIPPGYILNRGDLIVAMTEQAEGLLGSPAIIPESNQYLHNQRLGLVTELDVDDLDKGFLYYLFNFHRVRGQIRATASGVKVRHTSPSRIYEVAVDLPPLATQRKIASILSAYDDLIENNTRRIKLLEEMARQIYREWFVRFRFPGYEKVKMVESPLGPIPEGWEVRPIGEVIDVIGGGTPSTKNTAYWENGDNIWFTPSDLTSNGAMFITESAKQINELGLRNSSARLFSPYSVMMTSRATIGVLALNTKAACTNQGFIVCLPTDRLSAYQIYFWIEQNKERITTIASGATYKEISRGEFRELPIAIANSKTNNHFVDLITPVAKQIENLLGKNRNLRATRDLHLPKLISGEIDVSGLDIETGVSAA